MKAQKYRSRPYPNGWASSAFRRARWPPMRSSPWFPESATEWIASAIIDAEPVITKPMNLEMAMPRLAASAATTALVPCPPPAMPAR